MRRRIGVFLLAVAVAIPVAADQLSDDAVQRLATLGRVWGLVKFAHPYLGYRNIDWDAAAVRAIPDARDAQSPERFAAVVDEMLSALGDPDTRVIADCVGSAAAPRARAAAEGALIVTHEMLAADALDPSLAAALKTATNVVVDLRTPPGECGGALPQASAVVSMLYGGDVAGPVQRFVYHYGYHSQRAVVVTSYDSFWVSSGPDFWQGTNDSAARVALLVDEASPLPPNALALARSGRAVIVSVGPFHQDSLLQPLNVDLGGGYRAIITRAEFVTGAGSPTAAAPLITLPAGMDEDAVMAAAINAVPTRRRAAAMRGAGTNYVWRADEPYASMHYPDFEYRILAAYRLWNVIEYFYAYKELIGDWKARLPQLITMMAAASTQSEYELAIAEAMTFVPDGHSYVIAKAFLDLRGAGIPPFTMMPVEGKPVVVDITDSSATDAGVQPGDELTAIDGRPVSERLAELRRYISASTEAALTYYAMTLLPHGSADTTARYTFRKPDGSMHDATLTRARFTEPPPSGKPWKILPGNVGYVDVNWLVTADIDAMFRVMDGTRGLILDMRGYPQADIFTIGRHLFVQGNGDVALFHRVHVMGGVTAKEAEVQNIGAKLATPYRGKTVMLIDERAQSASEHFGLICEAVAGTTFVGSPSAGANGNITAMMLPGANGIDFGGLDVRHVDGRQLQRVGILPDVPAPRTIDALAHGRDEVLEKAIEVITGAKP
jgi:C-terminal processing protease CtpA/Prc